MFTKTIFTVSALAFAVAFGATAQAQQGPAQGGATRQIVVEAAKDAGADQAKGPEATGAIQKQGEIKQAPPVVAKVGEKPVVVEKAPVVADKAPVVAEKAPVVAEKAPVVAEKAPVAGEKVVVAEKPVVVAEKAPVVVEKAPVVVVKKPHYGYSYGYGYRHHHCD